MILNSLKNKLKILLRNIKHFIKLLRIKEIPKINLSNLNNLSHSSKEPQSKLKNNNLILSSKSKKVHRTRFSEFKEMFRILDDMNIIYFTHSERNKYMNNSWKNHKILDIYNNSIFEQSKADIFRYTFLYEYGGFWLDFKSSINFNPQKLISNNQNTALLLSTRLIEKDKQTGIDDKILVKLQYRYLTNWFIGSQNENLFLLNLIDNICKKSEYYSGKTFKNPKESILEFTGPVCLTDTYIDYSVKNSSATDSINLVDEKNTDINFMTNFSRPFSILDNVTKFPYANLKNKKILN